MNKNSIKPHKGGRTARLEVRIRPEVKAEAERIAKDKGITLADLFEFWVMQEKVIEPR